MEINHKKALIKILQGAYSGEIAAALAYRGHWKSLKNPKEIESIQKIEDEEWIHRREVGKILQSLGSGPNRLREIIFWGIGRTLGILCHLIGWFLPMFFAGRLETQNVDEYQSAAYHAHILGLKNDQEALLQMAIVEKEHKDFFIQMARSHPWYPKMTKWFPPRGST